MASSKVRTPFIMLKSIHAALGTNLYCPGLLVAVLAAGSLSALTPSPSSRLGHDEIEGTIRWDARSAEHLLNRAGFGASSEEIAGTVEAGLEATVKKLIERAKEGDLPFFAQRLSPRDGLMREERMEAKSMEMDAATFKEDNFEMIKELRDRDGEQLDRFLNWWVTRMRRGDNPLGERMTLFWHGWFTSSYRDVKSSFEMIEQNKVFRTYGLGKFRELVVGIAKDPAMLEYLDNDSNRRKRPNENFARELMELFTLGEGNYTEQDVKEAARAFTGWRDKHGKFEFVERLHDRRKKTVLGQTGKFGGEEVIGILLEQEACSRYLAKRMIGYFEGVEPNEGRLEDYARFLMATEYDIAQVLEKLFLDPEFYRDEVVGTRIAGPLDFLVGSTRRLMIEPPARAIRLGSAALGQRLLDPPNVRGWEGGEAWVTTGTLMMRSNLVGSYLGLVDTREELSDRDRAMRALRRANWGPNLNFSALLERADIVRDAEIVEYMLESLFAVPPTAESRAVAMNFLESVRAEAGLGDGELLDAGEDSELWLRRLAHIVLSLPEANLN